MAPHGCQNWTPQPDVWSLRDLTPRGSWMICLPLGSFCVVSSFFLILSTTHLLSTPRCLSPPCPRRPLLLSAQKCPGGKALEKETMEVPHSHTGPAAFLQSVNLAGPPPPPSSGFCLRQVKKCVCVCVCLCVLSYSVISNFLQLHGLYPTRLLCPWDSPVRKLECVAISFSRGSSRPRDQTPVSCMSYITRQILYQCTRWEAPGQNRSKKAAVKTNWKEACTPSPSSSFPWNIQNLNLPCLSATPLLLLALLKHAQHIWGAHLLLCAKPRSQTLEVP